MQALRSLDLFSGIGGLTLALEGGASPIAYCEAWDTARAILTRNMQQGRLPAAPVFPDVRHMSRSSLGVFADVDLVAAGFPCVGFSATGLKQGLEDPRSALFYEVLRIVDEQCRADSPPLVVMENVPPILNMAMPAIATEFKHLNYSLRWVTMPAFLVGAPQVRRRWYCLAYQENDRHTALLQRLGEGLRDDAAWAAQDAWATPCEERMSCRDGAGHQKRYSTLGNSVVPQAVRHGLRCLVGGALEGSHTAARPKLLESGLKWPRDGYMCALQGQVYSTHTPPQLRPLRELRLVLDPACCPGVVKRSGTSPLVLQPMTKKLWRTPTAGCKRASPCLSQRSSSDLPTQLRYERGTPDHERAGKPDARFVEWLMGFPQDWTLLPSDMPSSALPRRRVVRPTRTV